MRKKNLKTTKTIVRERKANFGTDDCYNSFQKEKRNKSSNVKKKERKK